MLKSELKAAIADHYSENDVVKAEKKIDRELAVLAVSIQTEISFLNDDIEIKRAEIKEVDTTIPESKQKRQLLDIRKKTAEIETKADDLKKELTSAIVGLVTDGGKQPQLREAMQSRLKITKRENWKFVKTLAPMFAELEVLQEAYDSTKSDPRIVVLEEELEEMLKQKNDLEGILEDLLDETPGDDSKPTDETPTDTDPKTPVADVEAGGEHVTKATKAKK